jgi:hypothetical protein
MGGVDGIIDVPAAGKSRGMSGRKSLSEAKIKRAAKRNARTTAKTEKNTRKGLEMKLKHVRIYEKSIRKDTRTFEESTRRRQSNKG